MSTTMENPPAHDVESASIAAAVGQEMFAERRRRERRALALTWTLRVVALVVFVGLWAMASNNAWIDPLLISHPKDVVVAAFNEVQDSTFWTDALSTFSGAMVGLAVGSVLGIFVGVVFTHVPVLERASGPFLTLFNSLPRPALAPIFILWFGLGFTPKALVAASVVFFLLLTATSGALRGIDHDVNMLGRSLSLTPWQRFRKIELPSALPTIIGALRLGAVYSVLGAVLAEMVGAYSGLGQRLVVMTNNFQVAESFAVLLAMGFMAMSLDFAISKLERVVRNRSK
ncbi:MULTISPECIES: ABC transporter permease [Aeromicrobium]|uniref:ABC transporter permease n=1 Tax=Aeromicrobium TaxID=2040 RepID=UPI00257AE452|nr:MULTISPECIES: ABC transporter permease [Aeromicrobium]